MVRVVGRLAPGMTPASAARALSAWASATTADRPERERAPTVTLEPRATPVYMSPATMLEVSPLFVAFALVLLIACANVANMMLARGMARQRELGIRLALGASRGRLVRQLMTEALLLAVPAAFVGYALSRLALDVAVSLMFATVPDTFSSYLRVLPLGPDTRLFAFVVGCAVLAAVAFGLAPALQTTRTNVVGATRGELLRRDQADATSQRPRARTGDGLRPAAHHRNRAAARSPTPPVARRGIPDRRRGSGARATGAAVAGARAPRERSGHSHGRSELARGVRWPVPAGARHGRAQRRIGDGGKRTGFPGLLFGVRHRRCGADVRFRLEEARRRERRGDRERGHGGAAVAGRRRDRQGGHVVAQRTRGRRVSEPFGSLAWW